MRSGSSETRCSATSASAPASCVWFSQFAAWAPRMAAIARFESSFTARRCELERAREIEAPILALALQPGGHSARDADRRAPTARPPAAPGQAGAEELVDRGEAGLGRLEGAPGRAGPPHHGIAAGIVQPDDHA